ncbi:MAG TPA: hypothetical protein VGG56_15390 [Terracidiphilus sp.]|jgi:hypothetical protein
MATFDYSECNQRIARAHIHGQAAADIWNGLFVDNAYSIDTRVERDGVAVVKAVFSKPFGDGVNISLELGEMFYQLRAALDNATYKLAAFLRTPHPPANERHLYFPICSAQRSFEDSSFNANPFPDEFKAWIKSIQPCHIGKLTDPLQIYLGKVIESLNSFANSDRHRRVHIAGIVPSNIEGYIELAKPGRITFTEPMDTNFFEGKFELFRFGFEDIPNNKVQIKADLTPEIRVERLPIPPWNMLLEFVRATSYVVERFEMVHAGKPLVL